MHLGLLSLGDCLPDPATGAQVAPSERHRAIVAEAVHAEAAGFDSVWIGEHHFCDYVVSSPPVLLAAIAAKTERVRVGTAVTLLPPGPATQSSSTRSRTPPPRCTSPAC